MEATSQSFTTFNGSSKNNKKERIELPNPSTPLIPTTIASSALSKYHHHSLGSTRPFEDAWCTDDNSTPYCCAEKRESWCCKEAACECPYSTYHYRSVRWCVCMNDNDEALVFINDVILFISSQPQRTAAKNGHPTKFQKSGVITAIYMMGEIGIAVPSHKTQMTNAASPKPLGTRQNPFSSPCLF